MVPWIVKEGLEGVRAEACGDGCAEPAAEGEEYA
jgi:hypothetical protein